MTHFTNERNSSHDHVMIGHKIIQAKFIQTKRSRGERKTLLSSNFPYASRLACHERERKAKDYRFFVTTASKFLLRYKRYIIFPETSFNSRLSLPLLSFWHRLPKIKEWIDANDTGALLIPFSGVLETKLADMPDDERQRFLDENKITR